MAARKKKDEPSNPGLEAAKAELEQALSVIAEQPGGREALEKLAIELMLPIEERVRRENPNHPTLELIDEKRRKGLL